MGTSGPRCHGTFSILSTKSLHVKNYLWGNGTGEFEQPRQLRPGRKWKTTS